MALLIRMLKLLIVWVAVAIVIGAVIATICQPENAALGTHSLPIGFFSGIRFGLGVNWGWANNVGVGIGLEWWNLPGTIVGFIAGLYLSQKCWIDLDSP